MAAPLKRCACYPAEPDKVRAFRLWPTRGWFWYCHACGCDL